MLRYAKQVADDDNRRDAKGAEISNGTLGKLLKSFVSLESTTGDATVTLLVAASPLLSLSSTVSFSPEKVFLPPAKKIILASLSPALV